MPAPAGRLVPLLEPCALACVDFLPGLRPLLPSLWPDAWSVRLFAHEQYLQVRKELVDYIFDQIKEDNNTMTLSPSMALGVAYGLQQIPNPWMVADGLRRQSQDLTMPSRQGQADLRDEESLGEVGCKEDALHEVQLRHRD